MTYGVFDVILGVNDRSRNIGAIIHKYGGGITNINRGIGSGWANNYATGLGRYGSTWANGNITSKTISFDFKIYGTIYEFAAFRKEMAAAIDCPNGPERMIFNDEPNMYYNVVPDGNIALNESIGDEAATGTLNFVSDDGLAHAIYSKVLNKDSGVNVGSLEYFPSYVKATINNEGSVEAFPVIRIRQKEDNGYIGIAHTSGIAELGVTDSTLEGELIDSGASKSETLLKIEKGDNTVTGWKQFVDASDRYYESPIAGTICINGGKMSYEDTNNGYPSKGLVWDKNGTSVPGYRWCGGIASFIIPADSAGEVGAKNWRCDFNIKVWENRMGQSGYMSIVMVDADKQMIAAYDIAKDDTNGDKTKAKFWCNKSVTKQEIEFGANNNEAGQSNPNKAFNSTKGDAYIIKDGGYFTFGYDGTPYRFNVPEMEAKVCAEIIITAGRYQAEVAATGGYFTKLVCESISFSKTNVKRFDLVPNRYPSNSLLTMDNYDGVIYLSPTGEGQGSRSQEQLTIDSDFIVLPPGVNTLEFYSSKWVTTMPDIEIEIHESWL